jgi:hypothetical protein
VKRLHDTSPLIKWFDFCYCFDFSGREKILRLKDTLESLLIFFTIVTVCNKFLDPFSGYRSQSGTITVGGIFGRWSWSSALEGAHRERVIPETAAISVVMPNPQ